MPARVTPAKDLIMAKLCFQPEEPGAEQEPFTSYEINELTIAAQAISGIVKAMSLYSMNYPHDGRDGNPQDIFCSAFSVLEWLIEPIYDYLFENPYPAAPAKKDPKEDKAHE
jgi:hypothetical protein